MRTPESEISNPAAVPFVVGVGGLAVGALLELSGNSGVNSLASTADVVGLAQLAFAGVIAGTRRYNKNHYQEEPIPENPTTEAE